MKWREYYKIKHEMENLQEIIQFTAIGTYSRGAVYTFAHFLGYKDEIETSPTEFIPNPIDKVTFVENYIRQFLIDLMSEKNIKDAISEATELFNSNVESIKVNIKNEISQGVEVTSEIITI